MTSTVVPKQTTTESLDGWSSTAERNTYHLQPLTRMYVATEARQGLTAVTKPDAQQNATNGFHSSFHRSQAQMCIGRLVALSGRDPFLKSLSGFRVSS